MFVCLFLLQLPWWPKCCLRMTLGIRWSISSQRATYAPGVASGCNRSIKLGVCIWNTLCLAPVDQCTHGGGFLGVGSGCSRSCIYETLYALHQWINVQHGGGFTFLGHNINQLSILPTQHPPNSASSQLSILPTQYPPNSVSSQLNILPTQYPPNSISSQLNILPTQYPPNSVSSQPSVCINMLDSTIWLGVYLLCTAVSVLLCIVWIMVYWMRCTSVSVLILLYCRSQGSQWWLTS